MANYDRLNGTGLTTMLNRLAQLVEPVISILPISKGGTGNSSGYIRTGIKSNTTAATGSTIEGTDNEVSSTNGIYSHAEGGYNTVSGMYSHAEGYNNNISGDNSHVEGSYNTVTGDNSHASGYNVTSGYDYQTVIGRFNNNKSTTLFEVGNGTGNGSTPNENAFEVYADGHVNVKGGIYKNGTEIGYGNGTVTSVATGAGLTGGSITDSGTIKAKLKSETQSSLSAASKGSTPNREYAVGLDSNGYLSVNVPWESGGGGGVWTSAVSCLVGDTSKTISNSSITTSSIIKPYSQTSSGIPVAYKKIVVSNGSATITFASALTEAASIKLQIL